METPLNRWFDARGTLKEETLWHLTFDKIFPGSNLEGDPRPSCLGDLFESKNFLERNANRREFRQFFHFIAEVYGDLFEICTPENKSGEQLNFLRQRFPAPLRERLDREWLDRGSGCIIFTPREFKGAILPVMREIMGESSKEDVDEKVGEKEEIASLESYDMEQLEEIIELAESFAAKHDDAFIIVLPP